MSAFPSSAAQQISIPRHGCPNTSKGKPPAGERARERCDLTEEDAMECIQYAFSRSLGPGAPTARGRCAQAVLNLAAFTGALRGEADAGDLAAGAFPPPNLLSPSRARM